MIQEKEPEGEKWLIHEAAVVKRPLLFSFLFTVISGVLVIFQARFLAKSCHLIVIDKSTVASIYPPVAAFLLIAIVRAVFSFLSEKYSASAATNIKIYLRERLYTKVVTEGCSGRKEDAAHLVELITSGIDSLETYFTRFLPSVTTAAVLPLVILLFVIPSEWRASLVLLFSAPFIPLFMVLIGKGTERLNRKVWSRLSILSSVLTDQLKGLPDLRIFSAVRHSAHTLSSLSEEYRSSTMSVLRIAFLSAFTLEFFSTVGTAVVAVIVGFRLLSGDLVLSEGLFVLLLAPEFYLPLRTLGLNYHSRMNGITAAEKILIELHREPIRCKRSQLSEPPEGEIVIVYDDVSFKHATGRGGVDNLSLIFEPGLITAICGPSGAGKSTAATLMLALSEPDNGTITANGINILTFDPDVWRGRIAFLPQKPFFFSGTLKDNLIIGLDGVSSDDINAALDAAFANEFVKSLPDGLDTIIGEQGAGISGGELRRIALARIFLRNPSVVILDEPTAGLDKNIEEKVCSSLKKLSLGRTVIVISHREDTVKIASRVYRMAGGALIPDGEQSYA